MAGPGGMPAAEIKTLTPGDRIYQYVYAGTEETNTGRIDHQEPQPVTVVRVNRVTVTVRTNSGETGLIRFADIAGRVDWEEDR